MRPGGATSPPCHMPFGGCRVLRRCLQAVAVLSPAFRRLQRIRTGHPSRVHNRLIQRNGIPPITVAGMLGHSISILLTTYAHFIPTMQDQAAQLMDDILTPIPIELNSVST